MQALKPQQRTPLEGTYENFRKTLKARSRQNGLCLIQGIFGAPDTASLGLLSFPQFLYLFFYLTAFPVRLFGEYKDI